MKISKTSSGGNGTFKFTLKGDGGTAQDIDTAPNGSGSYTWSTGLTPGGSYDLTETPVPGWSSVWEKCTGAQNPVPITDGRAVHRPGGRRRGLHLHEREGPGDQGVEVEHGWERDVLVHARRDGRVVEGRDDGERFRFGDMGSRRPRWLTVTTR